MKQYTSREFIRLLKNNGYNYIRTNGSHQLYRKGNASVVVPIHLNRMIAQRLIKENGLNVI